MRSPLRSPAQVEGPQGVLPQPEKDLERPSSTRLEVLFNCVRLFATLWATARQAPLSMGFSRQQYWSGLPCPLQGIFPTHVSNPGLLHFRQILYHLSHQGNQGQEEVSEKEPAKLDLTGRGALYRKGCIIRTCNSDLSVCSLKYCTSQCTY